MKEFSQKLCYFLAELIQILRRFDIFSKTCWDTLYPTEIDSYYLCALQIIATVLAIVGIFAVAIGCYAWCRRRMPAVAAMEMGVVQAVTAQHGGAVPGGPQNGQNQAPR